jgi:chromosome segregation ATPase
VNSLHSPAVTPGSGDSEPPHLKTLFFPYFCDSLVVDVNFREADTPAPRTSEEFVMAAAIREIEAEFQMLEPTVLEKKVDRVQEDVAVLKADVKVLRSDVNHLQEDVTAIKTEVRQLSAGLTEHRLETEKSSGNLRVETKDAIGGLRSEMKDAIAGLRSEMKDGIAELRGEMKDGFAELRREMKESFEKFRDRRFTQIGWMIGTVIAAIGTAVTVLKFFAAP